MKNPWKDKRIVRTEYVYDGDRWRVPNSHATYLLRLSYSSVHRQHYASLYYQDGRNAPLILIRRWFAGLVMQELKCRIVEKRLIPIHRLKRDRIKGPSYELRWYDDECGS
ncbi:MAG: hypothetical protein J6Q84_07465 [Kiritimatiellae bacterium]|nr:hypothetical protein [Kiritimatiellia bacterium]